MKRWLSLATALLFAIQPTLLLAEDPAIAGPDTRLYLTDGTLIQGHLIERTDELFIIRVGEEIFTFERLEVGNVVTINSLGSAARTITVTEFPYISFLGGTVAFGLLSWLQFDRASDHETEADLNRENELDSAAKKLDDKADRARLYGWGGAVLAAGSLGVALIPHKSTRRVFPELSFSNGTPSLRLNYVYRF
jgi:hypothetical protein